MGCGWGATKIFGRSGPCLLQITGQSCQLLLQFSGRNCLFLLQTSGQNHHFVLQISGQSSPCLLHFLATMPHVCYKSLAKMANCAQSYFRHHSKWRSSTHMLIDQNVHHGKVQSLLPITNQAGMYPNFLPKRRKIECHNCQIWLECQNCPGNYLIFRGRQFFWNTVLQKTTPKNWST